MPSVELGIDILLASRPSWLKDARVGLLANQASVDSRLRHTRDRLLEAGVKLTAIFAPQHGYFGEQQANMIESDDFIDENLGIPVFSLYGKTRQPTDAMLSHIDVLVFDLQDVGMYCAVVGDLEHQATAPAALVDVSRAGISGMNRGASAVVVCVNGLAGIGQSEVFRF